MNNISFYNNKICLNVLAGSVENAKQIVDAAQGHVVVGLLSANYPTVEEAVEDIKIYQAAIDNKVSVGLGAGNPKQWKAVAQISAKVNPQHVNQIFTAVGYTRALCDEAYINALVSPCGKVGFLNISTGYLSREKETAIVPAATAIAMVKEFGGNSLKYFPMKGTELMDEFTEICKICAKEEIDLELTGGVDASNLKILLKTALENGVSRVIPHIYSAIVDKQTGLTKIEDVKKLFDIIKSV